MDENAGCGEYTERTVISWLTLGGRRLDCANSYGNSKAVGRAMKLSNVPRSAIFVTEKVGPPPNVSMGYADTLVQVDQLLRDLQTDYMDLLLVHEPVGDIPQSADPYCRVGSPVYTEKACRLGTWRAMVRVWQEGKALAIGVSNWNTTHLQEIVDAGLPLPSVNQCPFNLYHSSAQQELRDYCKAHNILSDHHTLLSSHSHPRSSNISISDLPFSLPPPTPLLCATQLPWLLRARRPRRVRVPHRGHRHVVDPAARPDAAQDRRRPQRLSRAGAHPVGVRRGHAGEREVAERGAHAGEPGELRVQAVGR